MTEQMAVKLGKNLYDNITSNANNIIKTKDYIEFVDMAIKALEKQVAKKCNIRDRIVFREGEYEPIKIKTYRCPICNHETGTCGVVPNYCMNCGQKLESRCEDESQT